MELKKMLVGLEGLKVRGDLSKDIKGIEKNSERVYVYCYQRFFC